MSKVVYSTRTRFFLLSVRGWQTLLATSKRCTMILTELMRVTGEDLKLRFRHWRIKRAPAPLFYYYMYRSDFSSSQDLRTQLSRERDAVRQTSLQKDIEVQELRTKIDRTVCLVASYL